MTKRLTNLLSAPKSWITMAAEMTEAATLTNSLPMRMVTMRRRGSLSRRSMRSTRRLPSARIFSTWVLLREKREVSVLEKKPEKPSRTMKMTSSMMNAMSKGVPPR